MRSETMRHERLQKAAFTGFVLFLCLVINGLWRPWAYGAADYCYDNTAVPPFLVAGDVDPNLLLLIDNSGSMYDPAYVEDDSYCFDDSYSHSTVYAGYFDTYRLYAYDFTNEEFIDFWSSDTNALWYGQAGDYYYTSGVVYSKLDATPSITSFLAYGNFLNWALSSKFDIQKKILTGGKYAGTDQQLVMESRGCAGRRFIKKYGLSYPTSDTYYLTLAIRGPDDDEKENTADDTTRIEIYNITTTGFAYDACQSAITELSSDSPNLGNLKNSTKECMGYSGGSTSESFSAFNHALQECWYYNKHGDWQPGAGTVNAMQNSCENIYGDGIDPEGITTEDKGYVCFGKYGTDPPYGYVGRCWEPAYSGEERICVDRVCDPTSDPTSGDNPRCNAATGLWEECSGSYNANKDTCNKDWVVIQDCTGGGSVTEAGWTDDQGDGGYACVDQAIKDYCNILEIPEVIDPSDSITETGTVWNAPAVLIDSGVVSQLDEALCVMKGYIKQTTAPSGLIQEYDNDIRMGAMTFNDNGAQTECPSSPDPNDAIAYDCPASNRDGGKIIAYIDQSVAHTEALVTAVNDIKATSWTPLAEAMFNAIGYYTQRTDMRLNSADFSIGSSYDPCTSAWCQNNNILLITEGASTADLNPTVEAFASGTGQNDGSGDDCSGCGSLYGSTLLDDLTWYGKNGTGIFDSEPFEGGNKQNIKTYIVAAGSLRSTGSDECSPDVLLDNAAANGGTTLFSAEDPAELESRLRDAFSAIREGAAAGSAASVISASRSGEGATYQAIFWPAVDGAVTDTVEWIGEVHALLIDAYGNMYEDTDGDRVLDDSDQRVSLYFDEESGRTRACYGALEADGTCLATIKELEEVNYLWSANEWLSDITDVNILGNRSTFISPSMERYVFTWIDLDNDGIVDQTDEVLPFVSSTDWGLLINPAPDPATATRGPVPLDFGVQTSAEVNDIVKWVRGLDQSGQRSRKVTISGITKTWRLGDVVHSTPISVSRPSEGYHSLYRDSTYAEFSSQYNNRRHVIYFGANDGMLHAVNGGFYNEQENKFCLTSDCQSEGFAPELGAELWAYVPYNLLPDLQCLSQSGYEHKFLVDLRPRIFDVKIFADDTVHPGGWGTILVAGMRFGGTRVQPSGLDLDDDLVSDYPYDNREFTSAYIVFDITDPESPPVLLGELTRTNTGTETDLGYTTVVPTVVVMKSGASNDWYLVMGSGPTTVDGTSDQAAKLAVYPLKYLTGQGIAAAKPFRIPEAEPSSADQRGRFTLTANSFTSDMITADFDLEVDYKSDAVYFGTVSGTWGAWEGALYRLVTRSEDLDGNQLVTEPSDWSGLLTASGLANPRSMIDVAQPVTGAAAVGSDGDNYWIYFGTGRFLYSQDKSDSSSNGQQTFYGIKEPLDSDGDFTWQTVEKTGTYNGTAGDRGLLQVDQIQVQEGTGNLSCIDDTTNCLPTVGTDTVTTFDQLTAYMGGTDGWYRNFLNNRERNLGQGTLLGGLLTFTTYQPFEDICMAEGLSYLYAVYYTTGTAWMETVFEDEDETSEEEAAAVVDTIQIGRGLATTPNLHVGQQEGSTAFVQTSTGAIVEIPQPNLPIKNQKTGKISWIQLAD